MQNIIDFYNKFDEQAYLHANPDVAAAVEEGSFASGCEHFITCGLFEDRAGVSPEKSRALKSMIESGPGTVVPPAHLRNRVSGSDDYTSFENLGRTVAYDIFSELKPFLELGEGSKVLDFGCGCGRIVRYFQMIFDKAQIWGTDIDDEATSWCRENLAHIGKFGTNPEMPPLIYDAEQFDFIYSISIFTHLPEEMHLAWLAELHRVTKPGGYLCLTIHGEDLLETVPELRQQLKDHGFFYAVGPGTEGLPEFYQTSFHTEEYIYSKWGVFFEIKKVVKKAIANHQDLVICQRRRNPRPLDRVRVLWLRLKCSWQTILRRCSRNDLNRKV